MPSNFSSLRQSRDTALQKLAAEIKKENQKGGADERFWKLSVDQKTKIGFAKLRFLPAPPNEELPWRRLFSHSFTLNGQWFIENCPTTFEGRTCPCCKENNKLWNSGVETDKDVVRQRKRKLQFISNILVLEDPAHSENNGKVFLFKYGAKIHAKIEELINPQFPDQKPTDPFDLWIGADFKLKSTNVGGYQNYDKSEFAVPTPLFGDDDDAKEALWGKEYPLTPFVAEDQFKSYETLEKRLNHVLTGEVSTAEQVMRQPTTADAEELTAALAAATAKPPTKRKLAPKPVVAKPDPAETEAESEPVPESEEDITNFFASVLQ